MKAEKAVLVEVCFVEDALPLPKQKIDGFVDGSFVQHKKDKLRIGMAFSNPEMLKATCEKYHFLDKSIVVTIKSPAESTYSSDECGSWSFASWAAFYKHWEVVDVIEVKAKKNEGNPA